MRRLLIALVIAALPITSSLSAQEAGTQAQQAICYDCFGSPGGLDRTCFYSFGIGYKYCFSQCDSGGCTCVQGGGLCNGMIGVLPTAVSPDGSFSAEGLPFLTAGAGGTPTTTDCQARIIFRAYDALASTVLRQQLETLSL
ncbi:MAG: hypothetical protein SF070_11425 [Gemmatimonadota bacterium]|nr:hypothetical protein [Gemmatimonadota bacterium]